MLLMLLQMVVIVLSAICFTLLNRCFPPWLLCCLCKHGYDQWKWRNIVISLIHSCLSGLSALYLTLDCLVDWSNLEHVGKSYGGRMVLCMSIGYFIYDSLLSWSVMLHYPGRVEIIVHHVITMATLSLSLPSGPLFHQIYPYCVFGLIIEINNIFIHMKSLLEMSHSSKTPAYKANSCLVILTIFVFRFMPLYWISHDLLYVFNVPHLLLCIFFMPILAIFAISTIILYRTIQEDFV